MYKVTVALVAFAVFLGCDVGRPTSPSAAKRTEAAVEPCPMPILGIAGTWVGQNLFRVDCPACDGDRGYIDTVDTLRIELAPNPNPTGEPGVTYYDYTLLSYYSPSEWDDPALADLGLPSLYGEQRGKMGVYYADGGKWAFNHIETYFRLWDEETKEYKGRRLFGDFYEDFETRTRPRWGLEIKMFDGWLALGWESGERGYYDDNYERVDNTPVNTEHEEEHDEAVGLIVRGGTEIVRVESGQVTGEIEVGHGLKTALLSVRFIAEDGDLFTPDAGDGYALDWEIADESIAEVEHHAEDGAWAFHIIGLAEGQTTIRIKINHEGHANFVSPEIEIHVEESGPGFAVEITPEIIGLYSTLVTSLTDIFFAALVPGTTSVPGEGGGSVELSGNDWTLQDYSPDGELIINGALSVGLDQMPIPLSGEVTLSGSHEAELILDMEFSVGADGLSATKTITINGAKFDIAKLSAAATAAEAAG